MSNTFENQKVLMVMAHPDDEVIFGWPLLQSKAKVKILCCSDDKDNPDRPWCQRRREALMELGKVAGAEVECLSYHSEFYRSESRNGTLAKVRAHISEVIKAQHCDFIYTHNPLGEYGHMDHQLVHEIVMTTLSPLVVSDMFLKVNWAPYTRIGGNYRRLFYQQKLGEYQNNIPLYNKWADIYKTRRVWSWSYPPIETCGLFFV